MFDSDGMAQVEAAMRRIAGAFDPALVSPADAAGVVARAATVEKLAATVKTMAAARAAEAAAGPRSSERTAAERLARQSGVSLGAALAAIRTGQRLGAQPQLEAAARQGQLSAVQVGAISRAAAANPAAERRLVALAPVTPLNDLLVACDRARAEADTDAAARHRRVHAERFARQRACPDGAGEIRYRSTVDDIARVWSVIEGFARAAFDRAHHEGRHEPAQAYLADGVADMAATAAGRVAGGAVVAAEPACEAGSGAGGGAVGGGEVSSGVGGGGASGGEVSAGGDAAGGGGVDDRVSAGAGPDGVSGADPPGAPHSATPAPAPGRRAGRRQRRPVPTKVIFRIDWPAYIRGHTVEGEVCEVAGVGPVPVEVVDDLVGSGDAVLAAVVTKGVDVVNVAHLGRRPSSHQLTGLEWRVPRCAVAGCTGRGRLEVDHRIDWSLVRRTRLADLDWLCGHHHDLKTRHHWALAGEEGRREMVPPDDPRHPGRLAGAGARQVCRPPPDGPA